MTEEEFNRTLKELDVVLLDVVYDKFETPLDVAKFVITLNKINERMIIEENEELKEQIEKMKSCQNCKHCDCDNYCGALFSFIRHIEGKCDYWELR